MVWYGFNLIWFNIVFMLSQIVPSGNQSPARIGIQVRKSMNDWCSIAMFDYQMVIWFDMI
jgi:hypothetical protein